MDKLADRKITKERSSEATSLDKTTFGTKIPNQATRKALQDAQAKRNLVSFNSLEALFEELEI